MLHAERSDHLPKWIDATEMHTNLTKKERRTAEAVYITAMDNINTSTGFFPASKSGGSFNPIVAGSSQPLLVAGGLFTTPLDISRSNGPIFKIQTAFNYT